MAIAFRRPLCAVAVAAVATALVGCSSAPPIRYHTLMPAQMPQRADGIDTSEPIAIVVESIRLPVQVDQPQWLVRLPDGSVAVLEQDRWASPLRDELRQALTERLVVRFGLVEARAAAGGTTMRIAIEIRRFDAVPGEEARVEVAWTLGAADPRARFARCEWFVRESAATAGTPALAAAQRRAVARLGDAIGEGIRRLVRDEAVACPKSDAAG